ncbi:MAG: hypothetical protein KC736_04850 [Candidatus Moranbacteria bacterium]|nr:hypothetical protein [Candidatus Moranbacteria bacterium]
MRSRQSPRWARMLLFYCTFYLVFIYFGLLGYYPEFVNKFQFSRAIPLIGFLLLFCFAAFLHTVFVSVRSRFIFTVIVVLIAVSISQSISTVSLFSGWPATSLADPVSDYFSDKQELREGGSIYFKNFSESSYLGDSNFRFVNSYNQHLMPNPYPVRFDRLMKTDISYTGVTDRQIELINDYSLVLGVEYLFVPLLSPLVDGLTVEREGDFVPALFEKVSEVGGVGDVFAVLRNRQPIANAYVFDEGRVEEYFRLDDFPKPTLKVSSYVVWDEEIQRVASFIRDESILPIELSFVWPDGLVVDTSTFSQFENPGVLINQSFDNGWSVENMNHVSIEPTSLRFMHLSFSGEVNDSEVVLKNSWPWWHWPVQSLGIVMVFLTTSALVFSFIRRRRLVRHQSE